MYNSQTKYITIIIINIYRDNIHQRTNVNDTLMQKKKTKTSTWNSSEPLPTHLVGNWNADVDIMWRLLYELGALQTAPAFARAYAASGRGTEMK